MQPPRRTVLNAGAALLAGAAASTAKAQAQAPQPIPPGNPGDFDFLAGEWRIAHRRQPAPGAAWEEFTGEATCWSILGGVGSIEELRIPQRNFAGMGLRLLDVENRVWSDFWVKARSGVLTTPGQTGGFENGVGTFGADDMDGDQPIKVRGTWDNISPSTCRWRQAISRDGGQTWEENWIMDWTKV